MWSYYGAKTNVVKLYPRPKFGKIREPFAGSARYALEYFEHDVLLIDKYEVIIKIWKYLQSCSPKDILSLPRPKAGQTLFDYTWDCEEQKLLMGFVVTYGSFSPGNVVSVSKAHSRGNFINYTLNRIAKSLFKIRHWKFECADYRTVPMESDATYFVDPPYKFGGHKYKCSNKHIDFNELGTWCRQLPGQVIVCENTKADWLEFKPIIEQRGSFGKSTEAIWTSEPTLYDNVQLKLFNAL